MSSFTIDTSPDKHDVTHILEAVWGNSPVLTYVSELVSFNEFQKLTKEKKLHDLENKSIAVVIKKDSTSVGCVVLKINTGKEIELGSLAVLPNHRGSKLSSKLLEFLKPMCKTFISHGYSLVTYATVGSPVLFTIVDVMQKLSGIKPIILQFTPGVVPVERTHVSSFLPENLRSNQGETSYTSTVQLISTKEIKTDTKILNKKYLLVSNDTVITHKIFSQSQSNIFFSLPIRLTIAIINNTSVDETLVTIAKIREENTVNTIQYRVPVSSNFKDLITHFCDKPFRYVGFTVQDSYLYYVFIDNPADCFDSVKRYLETFPASEISESVKNSNTSPCI